MWKRLAAKELIEGRKLMRAAAAAGVNVPVASNGWQLQGTNRATLMADAEACFSRARAWRNKAAA